MALIDEVSIRQIERAIQDSPNDAELHFQLGFARFLQEAPVDAVRSFEKVNSLVKGHNKAHFFCGAAYTRMQSYELAFREWEKMVDSDGDLEFPSSDDLLKITNIKEVWKQYNKNHPGDIFISYQSGLAFLILNDIQESLACFNSVYESNNNFEKVLYYRALALIEAKKPKEAADMLVKGLDLRSRDPLISYLAGVGYLESSCIAQSVTYLKKAVDFFPEYRKAHLALAKVYLNTDQFEEAIKNAKKALEFDKNSGEALFIIGQCYEKQYRMDEACEAYLKACAVKPDAKLHFQLGMLLSKLAKHEQALEHLDAYVKLEPDDADGYYYLGSVLSTLKRNSEAIPKFEQAVKRNGRHLYANYALGQACLAEGDCNKAAQSFEAALEINDKDTKARASLGIAYYNQGELLRAISEFEKVIGENSRIPEAHYYLGLCWDKLGNLESAKDEYQTAAENTTEDSLQNYIQGASVLRAGDTEKAKEKFQESSQVVPSTEEEVATKATLQLFASLAVESTEKSAISQQYAENVEDSLFVFMGTLSALMDLRDPYSQTHCQRVSLIAVKLANQLELDDEEVNAVSVSASLHDIGKIALPDYAWEKAQEDSGLTEEEMALYEQHPALGAEHLAEVPFPLGVIPAILSHHENWDGTGFPEGLKGEEIPLLAQIVGISDYYDRLTTKGEEGKALTPGEAFNKISKNKGTLFSEDLVDALDAILDDIILQ